MKMNCGSRIWEVVLWVGLSGLLALFAGCNNKHDEDASGGAAVAAPRPAALDQAAQQIKSGHAAAAQQTLEAFLKAEPKSQFHAEALYLCGQALVAQGQNEDGKKMLEKAISGTDDRSLKALAMLGRADCNMAMGDISLASRQYHWLETMYRDVKALPQDEVLFKLGLATKRAGNQETADYWFKQVVELYATGPWAPKAKLESSQYTPTEPGVKPLVYSLEIESYGKREKADAEAEILRAKGYRDVEVVATTINSLPVFEVHVGKFDTKAAALHAQTDAELAGLKATIRPAIIEPLK